MSISSLTGWDKVELQWSTSAAIHLLIEHHDEMERVAERFCCSDMAQAFEDIFEKGLQAMLDMCDMDDRLTEEEMRMENIPCPKGGSI